MRPDRAFRHSLVAAATVVGLGASLLAVAPAAPAVADSCRVRNLTIGSPASPHLQGVVDRASAGDTIQVKGTCVGKVVIKKELTLVGMPTKAVPQPTLDGASLSRVLVVGGRAEAKVVLVDLAITNGVGQRGGGITNRAQTVTLKGSTSVTGNSSHDGGGIFSTGDLTLRGQSTVADNTADYSGGGIRSLGGTITLRDYASVARNTALDTGGIFDEGGTVTLDDASSVSGNAAEIAGGIYSEDGSVTLRGSSSVSGNTATENGGGGVYVYHASLTMGRAASVSGNFAKTGGGGIQDGGVVTLNGFSSVTDNTTDGVGGGIRNYFGALHLNDSSSITRNFAQNGGGVDNYKGHISLHDWATLTDNTAGDLGGGVRLHKGSLSLHDHASVSGTNRQWGWWRDLQLSGNGHPERQVLGDQQHRADGQWRRDSPPRRISRSEELGFGDLQRGQWQWRRHLRQRLRLCTGDRLRLGDRQHPRRLRGM